MLAGTFKSVPQTRFKLREKSCLAYNLPDAQAQPPHCGTTPCPKRTHQPWVQCPVSEAEDHVVSVKTWKAPWDETAGCMVTPHGGGGPLVLTALRKCLCSCSTRSRISKSLWFTWGRIGFGKSSASASSPFCLPEDTGWGTQAQPRTHGPAARSSLCSDMATLH